MTTAAAPRLARRLGRVTPSATQQVLQAAARLRRAGVDVVDLGAGEPDFPTPDPIRAAGIAAITEGFTKYTPTRGILELREAICARYAADYGVTYAPEEVIVTAGGKQGLFNVAMALFDRGDEVVTHAPYWPSIVEQIKLAEAEPILVRTSAEDGFAVTADRVLEAVTPRTRAIILNSPGNPTGALIAESDLETIARETAAAGIWLVLDLCYERLIYDDVPHNLPRVAAEHASDRTVLVGSASKSWSMTGWRCGWALGPAALIRAAEAVQGHATTNVSSITQRAALEALSGPDDDVRAMLDEYRTRRDQMIGWLADEPRLRVVPPAGAFYLFPNVSELLSPGGIRTSAEFAARLLDDARVAVTPGEAFDTPGFVRLSYAASLDRLAAGADRLKRFAARLP